MYKALDLIVEKKKLEEPLEFFTNSIEKLKPVVEVRSRRVGGANYLVPTEVRSSRRTALSNVVLVM